MNASRVVSCRRIHGSGVGGVDLFQDSTPHETIACLLDASVRLSQARQSQSNLKPDRVAILAMLLNCMVKFESLNFTSKSGEVINIRHCGPTDADAFISFQKTIGQETTHTLQGSFNTPAHERMVQQFQMAESAPRSLRIGAFNQSGVMIGFMGFEPEWDGHPWISHVGRFWMMIRKSYWGQGLGKKLLAVLDDFAGKHDFKRIEAMVRIGNERAIELYKKAGYEIEGTRKYAAIIEGQVWDEYYIAKLLGV